MKVLIVPAWLSNFAIVTHRTWRNNEVTNGVAATAPYETKVYNYTSTLATCGHNNAWKDQLKSYDGQSISYDASGNPTNYLGKNMSWRGRKLIDIDNTAMEYDYNDLRIGKGNRKYYWQGENLIMERWTEGATDKYIYYYYDESGVSGINYNGSEYYFRKNIFGDVTAIYDNLGALRCRYVYDARGNHKIVDADGFEISAQSLNIGNVNPIRYRGYYFDREFGLYYLQTMYYDPNTADLFPPII